MKKSNKKYEITIEGLTVDFRAALQSSRFNEQFTNGFTSLTKYIVCLKDEANAWILPELQQELFARAYNYMRQGLGFDSRTGCAFAGALLDKVNSYRGTAHGTIKYDEDKESFVFCESGEVVKDAPIYKI